MQRPLVLLLLATLLLASSAAHAAAGLRVFCNVDGARVWLDGKEGGPCPAKIVTSAGSHTLEVLKAIDASYQYYLKTQVNFPDGQPQKIDAKLSKTYTEEGWYRRGNDDEYLQHYPSGQYAKAIHDKRRQAEAEVQRAQREAAAALRRATLQQKEAQRLVERERKQQAANWRRQFDTEVAKLGASWRDCADCPEMVLIPPGNFVMGSVDPESRIDEWPPHAVSIGRALALGKFAVTVAQHSACAEASGCRSPEWLEKGSVYNIHTGSDDAYKAFGEAVTDPNQPIVGVSWDDARAYAAWLGSKTGQRYHLPSEAQCEYAARAGSITPFYTGHCINTAQANFDATVDYNQWGAKSGVDRAQPVKVGSFATNAFGLHVSCCKSRSVLNLPRRSG
jgi:formylglycine-generating enzyme required for sulfatase activity